MVILKSVQWAPLLPILLILGVCVYVCVLPKELLESGI